MLTIRNLPDDVRNALRARAIQHGQSTEAEVRDILTMAVKPEGRFKLGDAIVALGRKIGLTDKDIEMMERKKDKKPAKPLRLK